MGCHLWGRTESGSSSSVRNLWFRGSTELASNEAKNQIQVYLIPCSMHFLPGSQREVSAHGKGHEEGGLAYAKA